MPPSPSSTTATRMAPRYAFSPNITRRCPATGLGTRLHTEDRSVQRSQPRCLHQHARRCWPEGLHLRPCVCVALQVGVPTTLEVDMVIGADGANSRVAKDIDAGECDFAIAFQVCVASFPCHTRTHTHAHTHTHTHTHTQPSLVPHTQRRLPCHCHASCTVVPSCLADLVYDPGTGR